MCQKNEKLKPSFVVKVLAISYIVVKVLAIGYIVAKVLAIGYIVAKVLAIGHIVQQTKIIHRKSYSQKFSICQKL